MPTMKVTPLPQKYRSEFGLSMMIFHFIICPRALCRRISFKRKVHKRNSNCIAFQTHQNPKRRVGGGEDPPRPLPSARLAREKFEQQKKDLEAKMQAALEQQTRNRLEKKDKTVERSLEDKVRIPHGPPARDDAVVNGR